MNRYINILIFFAVVMFFIPSAIAQNITVTDFQLDQTDLTAMQEGTKVLDPNGDKCAVIKIETPVDGFTFNVGSLGVMKTTRVGSEIWVYVPYGVKKLTLSHQKIGMLDSWPIPCSIEKGRTYKMKITTANVRTIIEEAVTSQYLVFQVQPPTAVVELNGEMLDIASDGTAQKYLPFGTYNYTVQAANYHPESGTVTINDPNNPHVKNISLKPAFGWIEVTANNTLTGAAVYVDNQLIGKVPVKSGSLASGQHTVRISRSMYSPYSQQVTVSDNQTTNLSPVLASDFANLTLTVHGNAEIWVNGEKKGSGTWSGALGSGDYRVETKLANHRTATRNLSITPSQNGQTINLDAPEPIYGKINVSVMPSLADIYLDGVKVGQTPRVLQNILIGQHSVRVSKTGFGDYNTTVNVQEAQTSDVTAKLSDATNVTLTFNPRNASLTIDGQSYSTTQSTYSLSFGTHTIAMSAEGYKPYSDTIEVTESGSNTFNLKMESKTDSRAVDLGLSVKWASMNIGANSPEDYGDYYTWGETATKSKYDWSTLKYCNDNKGRKFSKYNQGNGTTGTIDNKTTLDPEDDVAHVKWGGNWRMPTKDEFEELEEKCTWKWTTQSGKNGYLVTSKINGNSIFLPAAGYRYYSSLSGAGSRGYYWSSSLDESGSNYARYLYFYSSYHSTYSNYRFYGRSVRPVTE